MDAGPRNGELSAAARRSLPWARATCVWMLMMVVETANGFVRELFVAPHTGALRARQIGVFIGAVCILAIAWATARWMAARTRREQLFVGAFWVALTVSFEMALGRAMGLGWHRLLSDYNPLAGGFMLLGLAVMFIAPVVTAKKS